MATLTAVNRRGPEVGELVADPLTAVGPLTVWRHDNIVFLPAAIIKDGPRARTVARTYLIFSHTTGLYRQARIELFAFRRTRQREPFVVVERATIDEAAVERLLARLLLVTRLSSLSIGDVLTNAEVLTRSTDSPPEYSGTLAAALAKLLSDERVLTGILDEALTGEALENLQAATQHARLKQAVKELRGMMDNSGLNESTYQKWFEEHASIFGTEYIRRVPKREIGLHSQADFALVSVDDFVDILELKKPSARPLLYDPSHNAYYPSAELAKALGQVMGYLGTVSDMRQLLARDWDEQVYRPRGIIVIGRSDGWSNAEREAWRGLKTSLQNIELLTFDHVLARADRLIAMYEEKSAD